ncbi:tetratricopeptide repeat-containing protein [Pontibaca salina]|uniref:Tetratricopeptide repeat-containing protein n=1 Tax=Pontibaca salina TaxID=2795731 RepID=A0A934HQ42_9RHOB|nr:tetratricopeptide repeat-containing protein [Pontibaca salina]MBI6628881.1 tetratricopeptide repeat-containing protein [Pontibaca salina]
MSAPHIWGFSRDDREMQAARAAGWTRADLVWERLMEAGNRRYCEARIAKSAALFRQAEILARLAFERSDLRRATSAASLARIAMHNGDLSRAQKLQRRALCIWRNAPEQIAAMKIAPRSRSSLFHLRMEVKHRDTFHDNMRIRFSRFAAETEETLRTLTAPTAKPRRHFSRWRGERPGMYDDTRKIIGACLLITDQNQKASAEPAPRPGKKTTTA